MTYKFLRKKYSRFVYESYSYKNSGKDLKISFNFKIEPDISFNLPSRSEGGRRGFILFAPTVVIRNSTKVNPAKFDNLIFHLGLIEMISYWKTTCSPVIEVKTGHLNKEQIKWWQDLIMKGMGQFFYENKINFRRPDFLKIISLGEKSSTFNVENLAKPSLIPVGGGKDSVVTMELLKRAKKNIRCFSLNPTKAALKIMKIAGVKKPIIVKRTIDLRLLELNRKGFLNGHTPFSAYLAFLSVLVAVIFNYKYIAFSNERSSNEGNVKYLGRTINHQWSKSFEFEKKFREYSKKYLAGNIKYFSFLRPLYEIQIAKLFSKHSKYFPIFLSCNEAYKTASRTKLASGKWCGKCSKCLFIFTILYPFLKKEELLKIFRKNLFCDKKLLPIMCALIGERGFKPFECVGTRKESLAAFYLSWKKYRNQTSASLPILLNYFEKKILPKHLNLERESKILMNSWNNQHNLPKVFKRILQKRVSKED